MNIARFARNVSFLKVSKIDKRAEEGAAELREAGQRDVTRSPFIFTTTQTIIFGHLALHLITRHTRLLDAS